MTDYDKTIEAMAKAIYEVDPYPGAVKYWVGLCKIAKRKSHGWYDMAKSEKHRCEERAKAALAALQETMPDYIEHHKEVEDRTFLPVSYGRVAINLWVQLKNLGK